MMTHFKLTIHFERGSYVGTSSVGRRGRRRGAGPELDRHPDLWQSGPRKVLSSMYHAYAILFGAQQFSVQVHVRVVV